MIDSKKNMISKYTPEEILEIFRAGERVVQYYYDTTENLGFETTIEKWREREDYPPTYRQIGKHLNELFYLSVDNKTWKELLLPYKEKTLEEVCRFISERAEKEIVEPLMIFGKKCDTAGIFRLLMKRLERRGMDTSSIKPSTDIQSYLIKSGDYIVDEVRLMAPQVLPPIDIKGNNVSKIGCLIWLAFFLFIIIQIILNIFKISLRSVIIKYVYACLPIGLLLMIIGERLKPQKYEFKDIKTFGDLVNKINLSLNKKEEKAK